MRPPSRQTGAARQTANLRVERRAAELIAWLVAQDGTRAPLAKGYTANQNRDDVTDIVLSFLGYDAVHTFALAR